MSELNAYSTFDPNAKMGAVFTEAPFEFRTVDNWQPINRGGMSKATGFTLYKDTGVSSKINAMGRYRKSDGTNLFIFSQGTDVYKLVSGTITSLSTTVADVYQHYETALDKLIICDGTNIPKTFDGTSVTDLATSTDGTAATGFKQTQWYKNRLFGFSATHDTSLLYYSDAGVISTGFSSNFINCDVNDGGKITSISKFFIPGTLEPVILVGKEFSTGVVTGDGTTDNPFTYSAISDQLGVPGFRQIVKFEQDALFLSRRGISTYQTSLKDINIAQRLLSRNILNQFTELSTTYLPDALGWFDWANKRVSMAVASGNSQYPNLIWHYDVDTGAFYKQTGFNICAAFIDTDGTLYHGDNVGKLYQHSKTEYSYNDSAISATLETPFMDFFEPDYYKRINHCKISFRGNGSYSIGVGTSLDYGKRIGSSHTLSLSAGAYTWGGGVWTDDPDIYQWGAAPLRTIKFFPANIFQNIAFNFTQSGADQPVDLFEMVFDVEYLDLI